MPVVERAIWFGTEDFGGLTVEAIPGPGPSRTLIEAFLMFLRIAGRRVFTL